MSAPARTMFPSGALKVTLPDVPVPSSDWLKIILGVTEGKGSPGMGIKLGGSRFPDSTMLPCLLVSVISPAVPDQIK